MSNDNTILDTSNAKMHTLTDAKLKFKNFSFQMKVPFVVYADFECIIKPLNDMCKREHVPCGFSYNIVCFNNENILKTYRGEDAAKMFVKMLEDDITKLCDKYNQEAPHLPFPNPPSHYKKCIYCNSERVPHKKIYDFYTGSFLGMAHRYCSLNYSQKMIPIYFHNMSHYDSHLFIRELIDDHNRITFLPKTTEDYITFSKYIQCTSGKIEMRFLDSYAILNMSIEKLTDLLGEKDFILSSGDKHVYPYEYMDSFEKFNDEELPPIKEFYSSLTDSCIEPKKYATALQTWEKFNIKNMGEYHDLYVTNDVLLLTDIFEKFRKMYLKKYNLDPAHYYSFNGLTIDTCLKFTGVELDILYDIHHILMFETVNKPRPFTKTVHCQMEVDASGGSEVPEDDGDKETLQMNIKSTKHIIQLDSPDIYEWILSQPLPINSFEWMTVQELHDWPKYSCILDVTMNWNYPLLFNEKQRIVVDNNMFAHFIRNGETVGLIHRGIKFQTDTWAKPFIQDVIHSRDTTTDEMEKYIFQRFPQSLYYKLNEDIRGYKNIKVITNPRNLLDLIQKNNILDLKIFSHNLFSIEMEQEMLVFSKPIHIGKFCDILYERYMYEKHCKVLEDDPDSEVLAFDNGSLIYSQKSPDASLQSIYLIKEFIGIKPRCYYLGIESDQEVKKCPYIPQKSILTLSRLDYLNCLKRNVRKSVKFHEFKCINHTIFSILATKLALAIDT